MRVFGSFVYVHGPKKKRRKLDAKAEKCILVGYSDKQKGYKCYNPEPKKLVSRDVVFEGSPLCYLPSPQTPQDSIMISEEEAREA